MDAYNNVFKTKKMSCEAHLTGINDMIEKGVDGRAYAHERSMYGFLPFLSYSG